MLRMARVFAFARMLTRLQKNSLAGETACPTACKLPTAVPPAFTVRSRDRQEAGRRETALTE